jgi:hypothetical protein
MKEIKKKRNYVFRFPNIENDFFEYEVKLLIYYITYWLTYVSRISDIERIELGNIYVWLLAHKPDLNEIITTYKDKYILYHYLHKYLPEYECTLHKLKDDLKANCLNFLFV